MSEDNKKIQSPTPRTSTAPRTTAPRSFVGNNAGAKKPFLGNNNDPKRRRIVRGQSTGGDNKGNNPSGNNRGNQGRPERARSEYEQKILEVRRVTRVVSGGRRMSFAVALAIGDKKGLVGIGTGKGADTAIAIAKALKQAKKNLIKVNLTDKMSIPREVSAKFNASRVVIRPNKNKGMVAGSSVRDVLTLLGANNVTGKINSGSKNKLTNARAVSRALLQIGKPAPVYTNASTDAFIA